MTPTLLKRGSNLLLRRTLYQTDGTTVLDASTLTDVSVELFTRNKTSGVFVLGTNPELRVVGTQLELEITSAVSALMLEGMLVERWRVNTPNALFVVDSSKRKEVLEVSEVLIQ